MIAEITAGVYVNVQIVALSQLIIPNSYQTSGAVF